jgi:hypothetical protein
MRSQSEFQHWTTVVTTPSNRLSPVCVCAVPGIWGKAMGWFYLEIYDVHGELVSAQDDATFEIAMDAARGWHSGAFGHICFREPENATAEQVAALTALGARRTA